MLNYVEITNDNIQYATTIQMKVFPDECAYQHYKDTIKKNVEYQKYYLVYKKDKVVGITGLYSFEDISVTNSIWLGWFGVLEEYRNKGIGKQILLDTIQKAKELSKKYPIKFFRLYTSERDNEIAQILYEKVMDIKEYYNNSNDFNYDNTCVIYSKSLSNDKVKYWNNEFLNLKEIVKNEEEGICKFIKLKRSIL